MKDGSDLNKQTETREPSLRLRPTRSQCSYIDMCELGSLQAD